MNDSDFQKLCESIKQAGEIKKGLRKPSRVTWGLLACSGILKPLRHKKNA